jgi:hypothetical protein
MSKMNSVVHFEIPRAHGKVLPKRIWLADSRMQIAPTARASEAVRDSAYTQSIGAID